ncbi:Cell division protein ZapE [Pseudomonas reidholzensis]|uniref:Cell division protein ZapE n=1 Tax=Pseudomonas reidholzensis TaxID=1785162 RepID=A0A383RX15_9PSED|nr:cell division protein ZapE [Pseudomonas reidholzensis]SYX90938.1 Cell division protein ZapE [Pseudomonas reidholzensis]
MFSDPLTLYRQALAQQGFVVDPAQANAVAALQACFESLQGRQPAQGVYLWGPVGRGKTWLMDQFHRCLHVPARRQHFHHFMAWVHQRLFQLNGTADPLHALASGLAEQIRVLCFDELFVSDIADAIILGRLFQVLFDHGVVIVATSNQPPSQLYHDGFNRERFLPAIAAIERHMRVLPVAGEQDHRLHPGAGRQRYWVRNPAQAGALEAVFAQLSPSDGGTEQPLQLGSRQVRVVRRSAQAVWCRFSDLCEQPLSALEFMALCDQFPAILMDGIPALSGAQRPGRIARGTEDGAQRVAAGDRQLPALSPKDDSVRRFIALVDECYDRRVALYLEAEVALEALYTEGYLAFPFQRTLSRLREMQLQRFA